MSSPACPAFPRALSVVEGFLFKTPRWDEYLLGAKANVNIMDKGGKLPLHVAIACDTPLEVVQAVLAAHPEAAKVAGAGAEAVSAFFCMIFSSLFTVLQIFQRS